MKKPKTKTQAVIPPNIFVPGDIINIDPEVQAALKPINELRAAGDAAFLTAARMVDEFSKNLWTVIRAKHPQLDGVDLIYNSETHKLTVTGPRRQMPRK